MVEEGVEQTGVVKNLDVLIEAKIASKEKYNKELEQISMELFPQSPILYRANLYLNYKK